MKEVDPKVSHLVSTPSSSQINSATNEATSHTTYVVLRGRDVLRRDIGDARQDARLQGRSHEHRVHVVFAC